MDPKSTLRKWDNGPLVIEGVLTTLNEDGTVNVAPMGPRITDDSRWMLLRPFQTSRSFANIMRSGEAVFHITDDVLLMARAAIGKLKPLPAMVAVPSSECCRLADTCRWFLLKVDSTDLSADRAELTMRVATEGRVHDFRGFNRAKHAVIEAAILSTRVGILSRDDIESQLVPLHSWVKKTGGPREQDALDVLVNYLHEYWGGAGVAKERQDECSAS